MPNLNELPLRDIHLPDPVSWWPLAFGWWVVFGAGCLLMLAAYLSFRAYLKPTLRKEALHTLDSIEKSFYASGNAVETLSELSTFLRRAMLSHKKGAAVAGVTGEAWLELLDQQLSSHEFSQGVGRILLHGPYLPTAVPAKKENRVGCGASSGSSCSSSVAKATNSSQTEPAITPRSALFSFLAGTADLPAIDKQEVIALFQLCRRWVRTL